MKKELPDGYSVRWYERRDRDSVLALEDKQRQKWLAQGVDVPMGDPEEPSWEATVVVVDKDDVPVLCMGARPVPEIGLTLDESRLSLPDLMSCIARAWGKLAVGLWRRGHPYAFCRITSPTPKWGNMLVKRARFERSGAPHFYFDIEQQVGGLDVHK